MKVLCLLISVVALTAVVACGQNGSRAASLQALNKKVPRLPNGTTVEEVEDRLGAPRNRAKLEDGEISLYYGLWQLIFDPRLTARIRYYKAGYWPPDRPVGKLDRDVRGLKLKTPLSAVERKLGKPESWEILVRGEKESVWYGPGRWKLVFSGGTLSRKILYIKGSPTS
jgi:hypothetical protein